MAAGLAGEPVLVLGVIVLAVGWVEDVAANRRPQLLPVGEAAR